MDLILVCETTDNGDDDALGSAAVEMTPELAKELLKYREAWKAALAAVAEPDRRGVLYRVEFWGNTVCWGKIPGFYQQDEHRWQRHTGTLESLTAVQKKPGTSFVR